MDNPLPLSVGVTHDLLLTSRSWQMCWDVTLMDVLLFRCLHYGSPHPAGTLAPESLNPLLALKKQASISSIGPKEINSVNKLSVL